ncbi:MAG: NUDIX domain-containing protein [Nanoarchaeota archaeon]|nr:NUDIX domain-containing protein [Nanoarchaeota archaeon]MBU1051078.1 NUDIX domain-containing protein [Nanoarchaeota archaeon]MBU1988489.1 NUDIX domain-containing protein [Nanoarchaeota archaeon]
MSHVVIKSKKGVLIVRRTNEPGKGTWAIPWGRIYKNEKLEDAAKRKAFEETSLKIKVIKQLRVDETMFEQGPFENVDTGVHTINITYLAEPIDENATIKLDETSSEYKWINKLEDEKNIHPYPKEVLKESGVFD